MSSDFYASYSSGTGGGGGSGGTVTSVSVVTTNGLAGTIANPTTTPAITLSTTVTGILQGNGTAISAATTGNLTDAGTDGITVGSGTGAVLGSGTTISQHVADTTHNGYLSSTDWNTFNGKQPALTTGNLTDAGTDGITVTGGTGAVVGSGTSLAQHVADATHNGYLSSTDWSTFNSKTTLSGLTTNVLVKATGATTVGNSSITDNGTNVTLAEPILAVTGSLASPSYGFSGADTNTGIYHPSTGIMGFVSQGAKNFEVNNSNVISMVPFEIDNASNHTIIAAGATTNWTLTLPVDGGSNTNILQTNGSGTTSWVVKPAGTVTGVSMTVPSVLSISGSPVTGSGTLAVSYSGTALPVANGGTAVTSVTTAPAATSFAGWDANKNLTANSHINSYTTTTTAAGTTTLVVGSTQQQYFTGSTTQTVVLPVTSTLVLGQQFQIVNNSTGIVTVQSSGANAIKAMNGGTSAWFTVILTSGTTAASWSYIYLGTTNSVVTGRTSYTPAASQQGFGTIGASDIWWSRVGENMILEGWFTTGTVAASQAQLILPGGLTIGTLTSNHPLGGWYQDTTGATDFKTGTVIANTGNAYIQFGNDDKTTAQSPFTPQNGNQMFNSSTKAQVNATIPIAAWAI